MGQNLKFLKRHGAPINWTSFLIILLIAIPVCLFTIPLFLSVTTASLGQHNFTFIEFIQYSFEFFIPGKLEGTDYYRFVLSSLPVGNEIVYQIARWLPFVLVCCSALGFVFIGIELIVGILGFIRGRFLSFRGPSVLATFSFIFILLAALCNLGVYIIFIIFKNPDVTVTNWWILLAYAGFALLIRIIIGLIYSYGMFDHVFVVDTFQEASIQETNVKNDVPMIEPAPSRKKSPDVDIERIEEKAPVPSMPIKTKQEVGIPQNLSSIGGHAFSENTALTNAAIPDGVTKIGISAFSNCVNLKLIVIPKSVTDICANAFFNCAKLEKIKYLGTKAEWKNIVRGSNWLSKAGTQLVDCTDGQIIVNPYH